MIRQIVLSQCCHLLEIDEYTKAFQVKPEYAEAWYARGMTNIKITQTEPGCAD